MLIVVAAQPSTRTAYGALRYRNQAPFRVPSPAGRAAGFALQAVGLVGASQFLPKLQVPLAFGAGVTVPAAAGPSGAPSDALPQIPAASQSGLTVRCPIDFSPSDVPADGVYGVKRVTRHAMFWSFGLLGLGTAFATPYATWVVLGAMPAAFAALGGLHQDSRYRRGMGGTLDPEMDARTSSFPFVALATGQQKWADLWPEIKGTNAGLAVLLAAGLALRRGRSLAVVRSALARKA